MHIIYKVRAMELSLEYNYLQLQDAIAFRNKLLLWGHEYLHCFGSLKVCRLLILFTGVLSSRAAISSAQVICMQILGSLNERESACSSNARAEFLTTVVFLNICQKRRHNF
jgi:hypothetical protein